MKVDLVRAHAAGMCTMCCVGIAACLTVLAVIGGEAFVGWMVAISLLIAFPIGIYAGLRRGAEMYSAPPAPEDAVARQGGFARGAAEVLAVPATVVVGGVLWHLYASDPLVPSRTAVGVLPVFAGVLAQQLIVWRTAAEVERRWPVRLVEGTRERRFRAADVYAVHLQPTSTHARIDTPPAGNPA